MRARSTRYVGWLTRHSRAVFAGALIAVAAAAYLVIWHLPLYSDLSYLLPGDAPSVKGAEALARRMPSKDVMLMVLRAADPQLRESTPTTPTCASLSERTATCSSRWRSCARRAPRWISRSPRRRCG